MADDNKTRLVMLASEMKIMKKVPDGTYDRVKEAVPPEVWTNRSFARRWLLSGGTVPVRQRKERVFREKLEPTVKQRAKIERDAKGAAIDFVGDRMSDINDDEDVMDSLGDCARDLADAVLYEFGNEFLRRNREWVTDHVYDAMMTEVERLQKKETT